MRRMLHLLALAALACGCATVTYTTDIEVLPGKKRGTYFVRGLVREQRKAFYMLRVRQRSSEWTPVVPGLACDVKLDTDDDSGMVFTVFIPRPAEKKQTYCSLKLTSDGTVLAEARIRLPRFSDEPGSAGPPSGPRSRKKPPASGAKTSRAVSPALPVHARVKAVDESIGFVALDIGTESTSPVKEGDTFHLHRDGMLVAVVKVRAVDRTTCATDIVGKPSHSIRVGDHASRATAP